MDIICFANDWAGDRLSKKQVMLRLARHLNADLVEHERTGLLSPPGDWSALADNVVRGRLDLYGSIV